MFGSQKLKARIAFLESDNARLFNHIRHQNSEIGKAEKLMLNLPSDTPGLSEWFSRNGSRVVDNRGDAA